MPNGDTPAPTPAQLADDPPYHEEALDITIPTVENDSEQFKKGYIPCCEGETFNCSVDTTNVNELSMLYKRTLHNFLTKYLATTVSPTCTKMRMINMIVNQNFNAKMKSLTDAQNKRHEDEIRKAKGLPLENPATLSEMETEMERRLGVDTPVIPVPIAQSTSRVDLNAQVPIRPPTQTAQPETPVSAGPTSRRPRVDWGNVTNWSPDDLPTATPAITPQVAQKAISQSSESSSSEGEFVTMQLMDGSYIKGRRVPAKPKINPSSSASSGRRRSKAKQIDSVSTKTSTAPDVSVGTAERCAAERTEGHNSTQRAKIFRVPVLGCICNYIMVIFCWMWRALCTLFRKSDIKPTGTQSETSSVASSNVDHPEGGSTNRISPGEGSKSQSQLVPAKHRSKQPHIEEMIPANYDELQNIRSEQAAIQLAIEQSKLDQLRLKQQNLQNQQQSVDSTGSQPVVQPVVQNIAPQQYTLTDARNARQHSNSNIDPMHEILRQQTDILQNIAIGQQNLQHNTTFAAGTEVRLNPDMTSSMPKFDGNPNLPIRMWLTVYFEPAALLLKWTDHEKLHQAISKLDGEARSWHTVKGKRFKTWPEWVAAVKKYFTHPLTLSQWHDVVKGCVQQPLETCSSYYIRMLTFIQKHPHYDTLTVSERIDFVREGLIKQFQIPIASNKPADEDTLEAVLLEFDRTDPDAAKKLHYAPKLLQEKLDKTSRTLGGTSVSKQPEGSKANQNKNANASALVGNYLRGRFGKYQKPTPTSAYKPNSAPTQKYQPPPSKTDYNMKGLCRICMLNNPGHPFGKCPKYVAKTPDTSKDTTSAKSKGFPSKHTAQQILEAYFSTNGTEPVETGDTGMIL